MPLRFQLKRYRFKFDGSASRRAGNRCGTTHIKPMRVVTALIFLALFALLAGALWYAYDAWTAMDLAGMPGWMYAAMAGGVLFSLLVGCGLMALVFYSSRHGYDDRASSGDLQD